MFSPNDGNQYASVAVSVITPMSRGNISISSADTADHPLINPQWLTHPTDKAVLVAAQKAWLVYRDKELKLINKISDEKYSGGGTIWQVLNASDYYGMVKQRTIEMHSHYWNLSRNLVK